MFRTNIIKCRHTWRSRILGLSRPGEVVFSDIFSLNPTISVENYGTYTFTYFGCGLNNSITVNFNTENPIINPQETIFCSYEATLEAYSDNPQGWTFISGPTNSSVLIENPNSEITNVQVSEYGLYQFMFEGCGGNDIIDLLFEPIPPTLIASEHEDCLLESNLLHLIRVMIKVVLGNKLVDQVSIN